MDKLYFLSGPLQGATAELIGDEITIGRAPDNGICIDDESVSDHHAVIYRQNKECILRDLQSAKGTIVGENKIIVVTLEDSNRITFGSVEAEFTTTEIKLHMPETAVLPRPAQTLTWPQRKASSPNAEGSRLKSAVLTLVQLVALAALAGGGYFAYHKLRNVNPSGDTPSSETDKATSLAKPATASAQPSRAETTVSLPPTPQPSTTPAVTLQPAAPAVAAAPIVAPVAPPAPPNPEIQQAKLLIAQNKYQDAILSLDKIIGSTTDPAIAAEAQAPLKQALNAQLSLLQSTRQQWQAQCKLVEDRLKAAQGQLTQDTKALEKKKADEAKTYRTSGGYWFNGRWVYSTRKGTGDSSAQSAIQGLQIKVMTDAQEVKKQTDLVTRYQPQIIAFDQQIAVIQARVAQVEASQNSPANSGAARVQGAVQGAPATPEPAPASTPLMSEPVVATATPEPAPVPAPAAPAVTTPESSAASVELDQLKPEDWVRTLPAQAQSAYLLCFYQRGTTRVDSLRHWLSVWSKHMQEPNLTLLELDYIKYLVQLRNPSLNKALAEARKNRDRISQSEWGDIQQAITRKMSDLTSAGNKLTAMNLRSGNQAKLAAMIGETVDLVTNERAEMKEHYCPVKTPGKNG